MRFVRRRFWHLLQAGAALLVLILILQSDAFWESVADPAAAEVHPVFAVLFAPVLAAACVFGVSHIGELIWADLKAWRTGKRVEPDVGDSRIKRPRPLTIEVLPPGRAGIQPLAQQDGRHHLHVPQRPAGRKALK